MFLGGVWISTGIEPSHMHNKLKDEMLGKIGMIQAVSSVDDFRDKAGSLMKIYFNGKTGTKWD